MKSFAVADVVRTNIRDEVEHIMRAHLGEVQLVACPRGLAFLSMSGVGVVR